MRISFDVDDTLVCYGDEVAYEPSRVPLLLRPWFTEPLRAGAPDLMRELIRDGHEVWIYTTSLRDPWHMKRWLGFYGVRITDVINDTIHMAYLKKHGYQRGPSKLPSAWRIDLHVDDSEGVQWEGNEHGFSVVVVAPDDPDWAQKVRTAVARLASRD